MTSKSSERVTQQSAKSALKPRRKVIKPQIKDTEVKAMVQSIIVGSKKPDAETTAEGLKLRRLKDLVETKDLMDGRKWPEWALAVFGGQIDINLLRLLNEIALAPDEEHRKVLLARRAGGAHRSRELRKRRRQAAEQEKRKAIERQWIIRWATSEEIADVRRAWRYIKKTFDA
jgi:hypothetical protein